jgi:WD40 repeat protein
LPKHIDPREDIYLYETETGNIAKILSTPEGYSSALAYAPNGRYLMYWNPYKRVGDHCETNQNSFYESIEIETGRVKKLIQDTPKLWANSPDRPISFSMDGKYLLSGGEDGAIRVYEVATNKLIRRFAAHTRQIQSVVFSPDKNYILSGSTDKTVKLWNVQTGHNVATINAKVSIYSVAFSPDGRYIAACGGQKLMIWEMIYQNKKQ